MSDFKETLKCLILVVNSDELDKTKYLINQIYRLLKTLYGEELSQKWIFIPNKNLLFNGKTPLEHMQQGGYAGICDVYELLNAYSQA